MPAVGDVAHDFVLPTDNGNSITLSQFKGQKNVVLYFYPKDDTPGCTTEAKDFRDAMDAFTAANTVIIGISKDDVASHDEFKAKYCLPFNLASDSNSDICERYAVWGEKNMYGKKYMGITRATFLVDQQGKIAKVWPRVKVEGHAQDVLKAAQALA
jgi:peroxiredoxin Q/BCP